MTGADKGRCCTFLSVLRLVYILIMFWQYRWPFISVTGLQHHPKVEPAHSFHHMWVSFDTALAAPGRNRILHSGCKEATLLGSTGLRFWQPAGTSSFPLRHKGMKNAIQASVQVIHMQTVLWRDAGVVSHLDCWAVLGHQVQEPVESCWYITRKTRSAAKLVRWGELFAATDK